jgi:diaminohydroxyphosphoribosylaminopyrimidine deaminase/5-amino-6-(5-phosphoribosylamino)uracil reductase
MTAAMPLAAIAKPDLDEDERFMAAALALGRRGLGLTAPNPAVGALVVKDGTIVGRGCTGRGGRPHAETEALREAGKQARGAVLYVTLEPCSHHGKTPPCAEAIIAAGIAHVVSALDDPDPRVAGRGHRLLIDAGLKVRTGVLADAARRANLGHILRVTQGRPMVTLKLAETADGFAAGTANDPRLAITASPANARVHVIRSMHDAIMVGSGTASADDPLLTVRLPGLDARKPLRIVLDSNLLLSPQARLVTSAADYPTLVLGGENASRENADRLAAAGVETAFVKRDRQGHLDLAAVFDHLAARGLTRIFCEGGPRLAASLIGEKLADEVMVFTSPQCLGRDGVPMLDADSRAILAESGRYGRVEEASIGEDRLVRYERLL